MAPSFDCCINTSFHKGTPVGAEVKVGRYNTYVTGQETADKAILIIADVHGISLVNTRVLADKYAQAVGARVYIPDFFQGEDLIQMGRAKPDADRGQLVGALLGKYDPRDSSPFTPTVEAIRQAQPSAKKVGAIGFCWGAPGAVYLGSAEAGKGQVDAVAFAHPSKLEVRDFSSLQRPGLFMFCQKDPMFPKDKQAEAYDVLDSIGEKGVFTRTSYYPFVTHGWSIKGDESDPYSAKAMAHAQTEAIGFFSLELSSS